MTECYLVLKQHQRNRASITAEIDAECKCGVHLDEPLSSSHYITCCSANRWEETLCGSQMVSVWDGSSDTINAITYVVITGMKIAVCLPVLPAEFWRTMLFSLELTAF